MCNSFIAEKKLTVNDMCVQVILHFWSGGSHRGRRSACATLRFLSLLRVGVGVFFVLLSVIDFPHATVQSGVAVDSDELRCPLFTHAVAPLVDDKTIFAPQLL